LAKTITESVHRHKILKWMGDYYPVYLQQKLQNSAITLHQESFAKMTVPGYPHVTLTYFVSAVGCRCVWISSETLFHAWSYMEHIIQHKSDMLTDPCHFYIILLGCFMVANKYHDDTHASLSDYFLAIEHVCGSNFIDYQTLKLLEHIIVDLLEWNLALTWENYCRLFQVFLVHGLSPLVPNKISAFSL
jgi:hypothetical protein